jgi:hypothetical protein
MRTFFERIEQLTPGQFVGLVASIAGFLFGMPHLLLGTSTGDRLWPVAVGFGLLTWSAGGLMWWIAIRRQQLSAWRTAWHITMALALADLIGFAFVFIAATLQTDGAYADAYFRAPVGTTLPGFLVHTLLRTPARLVGGALLVGLGRAWLRQRRSLPKDPRTLPEAATR